MRKVRRTFRGKSSGSLRQTPSDESGVIGDANRRLADYGLKSETERTNLILAYGIEPVRFGLDLLDQCNTLMMNGGCATNAAAIIDVISRQNTEYAKECILVRG